MLFRSAEGTRQSLRERGLADAWNVFNQQMAAREQRGEGELDDIFLALHDARDRAQKIGEARAGIARGCLQFAWPSATKIGCRCFRERPCSLQPPRPLVIFRGIHRSPGESAQRGRLAQWLERSPHTGEVQGSSPWSPTTHPTYSVLPSIVRRCEKRKGQVCSKSLGLRCRDRLWVSQAGQCKSCLGRVR